MKFISITLTALIIYLFYAYLMPANHTWLHGEWTYEDNTVTASMIFHKDGTVELRDHHGTYDCIYGYLATNVSMQCEISGTKKELRYTVSADKTTLRNNRRNSRYHKVGPILASNGVGLGLNK